mmetsp:Transcript_3470/g.9048  ORF Transcript_3470/g.9048 Transcript_3470/m.9048 type:complete len:243 (+) Transcript_3470:27-755(+)
MLSLATCLRRSSARTCGSWSRVRPAASLASFCCCTFGRTSASSSPSSRESTNVSGITKSGAGKRQERSPVAKLSRKRFRLAASARKSVCICTCSTNSSAALRMPSSRSESTVSHQAPRRRSHARSASSIHFTPGLRHFTAMAEPSPRSPKKTSAMLPLAWGRCSSDASSKSLAWSWAATSLGETGLDHAAFTPRCMTLSEAHSSSGKMSRRVDSHWASFTKVGPELSICLATMFQNVWGLTM